METLRVPAIIYDGGCGFCEYLAKVARRIDRKYEFLIEPYQSFPEELLQNYGTDYVNCSQKLNGLTARGKLVRGAHAVNYFLFRHFPWSILVVMIYLIPILLLLELIVYFFVAKYRGALSRFFRLEACRTKAGPEPK